MFVYLQCQKSNKVNRLGRIDSYRRIYYSFIFSKKSGYPFFRSAGFFFSIV